MDPRGSITKYVQSDGSTVVAQREYDSFGSLIPNSSVGTWPGLFGYQGQAWMEITSGNGSQRLLVSPTRLYDPADGRFLSRDPRDRAELSKIIAIPKPVYLYVLNTPLNLVDPDGRDYIVHPPNVTGAAYQAWWKWAAAQRGGILWSYWNNKTKQYDVYLPGDQPTQTPVGPCPVFELSGPGSAPQGACNVSGTPSGTTGGTTGGTTNGNNDGNNDGNTGPVSLPGNCDYTQVWLVDAGEFGTVQFALSMTNNKQFGEIVTLPEISTVEQLINQIHIQGNVTAAGTVYPTPPGATGSIKCREAISISIVSHRGWGASPNGIQAQSGEITFGVGHKQPEPPAGGPIGSGPWAIPMTFVSPLLGQRPRDRAVIQYDMLQLAVALSPFMSRRYSCSIEVYGCSFAGLDDLGRGSGMSSMNLMSRVTGCFLYGTDRTNEVRQEGWRKWPTTNPTQAGGAVWQQSPPFGRTASVPIPTAYTMTRMMDMFA